MAASGRFKEGEAAMQDAFFKKDPAVPASSENKVPGLSRKRSFRSEDLFGTDREIVIVHGASEYRLQITKAGKLILNK